MYLKFNYLPKKALKLVVGYLKKVFNSRNCDFRLFVRKNSLLEKNNTNFNIQEYKRRPYIPTLMLIAPTKFLSHIDPVLLSSLRIYQPVRSFCFSHDNGWF